MNRCAITSVRKILVIDPVYSGSARSCALVGWFWRNGFWERLSIFITFIHFPDISYSTSILRYASYLIIISYDDHGLAYPTSDRWDALLRSWNRGSQCRNSTSEFFLVQKLDGRETFLTKLTHSSLQSLFIISNFHHREKNYTVQFSLGQNVTSTWQECTWQVLRYNIHSSRVIFPPHVPSFNDTIPVQMATGLLCEFI